jgi:hypothetical protein
VLFQKVANVLDPPLTDTWALIRIAPSEAGKKLRQSGAADEILCLISECTALVSLASGVPAHREYFTGFHGRGSDQQSTAAYTFASPAILIPERGRLVGGKKQWR